MNGQQKFFFLIILFFCNAAFSEEQLPAAVQNLIAYKAASLQRYTAESIISSKWSLIRILRLSQKMVRNTGSLTRTTVRGSTIGPYVPEDIQQAFYNFRQSNQKDINDSKTIFLGILNENLSNLQGALQDSIANFQASMNSGIGDVVQYTNEQMNDVITDYENGNITEEEFLDRTTEVLSGLRSGVLEVFYTNIPSLKSDVSYYISDFRSETSNVLSSTVEELKLVLNTNFSDFQNEMEHLLAAYDESLTNDELYA